MGAVIKNLGWVFKVAAWLAVPMGVFAQTAPVAAPSHDDLEFQAQAAYQAKHFEAAAALYARAAALGHYSETSNDEYDEACSFARAGDKAKALQALTQAVNDGWSKTRTASDPDLVSLHGDPRFTALLPKLTMTSIPWKAYYRSQTLVRLPDGRRFNFFCLGKGGPTALLDGSLSQWSFEWKDVQSALARTTRVCAIDRAGYGFSDPGPLPRDAAAETTDLEQALKAAHMSGPYILVGHSFGGTTVRLFAYRHPDQVAGILLVDPEIDQSDPRVASFKSADQKGIIHYRHCLAQAKARKLVPGYIVPGDEDPCLPKRQEGVSKADWAELSKLYFSKAWFEVVLSETENEDSSAKEIDTSRHSFGSMPLIILSSDKAHFTEDRPRGVDADQLYKAWIAGHEDQAKDSSQGKNIIVDGASHFVFEERPEVFIKAFNDVVAQARRGGSGSSAQ